MPERSTATTTAMLDGTFDPLHGGHVGQLLRAHVVRPFDRAYILVNKEPTHKPNASPVHHRVSMARLAMAAVCDLPFDYEVVATRNTLEFDQVAKVDYKVVGPDSVISDIADSARHSFLTHWRMIVVSYPDIADQEVEAAIQAAPDELRRNMRYDFVSESRVPLMNRDFSTGGAMNQCVHSTDVRAGNFGNLIPDTVRQYIDEHHLYARPVPVLGA